MTKKEFLLDTLKYYTKDTNRRCATTTDSCRYSPKNVGKEKFSEGCAIGRHLNPKVQLLWDREDSTSIDYIAYLKCFRKAPGWMRKMNVDFLQVVQILHDNKKNWGKLTGLSKEGRESLQAIIGVYNLKEKDFKTYL